ncbi:hypothetical protein MSAN_02494300 [Mycena sanguinolenta]|uniref:Uncharacterized protein n=1 Tax=Mycena sanguinolenta TaxID=230812 RepID=A0A8H6WR96_9AGAR|nr:hypothetical protein MSAN_02494300 [Mycena sanguinolenta]
MSSCLSLAQPTVHPQDRQVPIALSHSKLFVNATAITSRCNTLKAPSSRRSSMSPPGLKPSSRSPQDPFQAVLNPFNSDAAILFSRASLFLLGLFASCLVLLSALKIAHLLRCSHKYRAGFPHTCRWYYDAHPPKCLTDEGGVIHMRISLYTPRKISILFLLFPVLSLCHP